eukprot:CAMPEP_0113646834 /NCGR_PEP_ID=MMETSP0017_2-20120614/24758_1 /TAXON_ID=2856 /ORGANISM="Cylindrotheca closterium" /LENGTH=83 /DNA_ID=CAMNT_0000558789 /DNA_START=412 /DNA_END=660 /DNA_ORIENTATION=+ /assembly_acc=CAM_ASM_000147
MAEQNHALAVIEGFGKTKQLEVQLLDRRNELWGFYAIRAQHPQLFTVSDASKIQFVGDYENISCTCMIMDLWRKKLDCRRELV